tara:strand:+ start:5319 stop:5585 length:267 start_codon:yes stop_codon:yes gene_type:complete
MGVIYKYPINVVDSQMLVMPEGYKIIKADFQNQVLTIWAIVNPVNKLLDVKIRVIETGHTIFCDGELNHIGTVQEYNLVWHVFEEEEI